MLLSMGSVSSDQLFIYQTKAPKINLSGINFTSLKVHNLLNPIDGMVDATAEMDANLNDGADKVEDPSALEELVDAPNDDLLIFESIVHLTTPSCNDHLVDNI